MQNDVLQEVVLRMSNVLDEQQLRKLGDVLSICFKDCTISKNTEITCCDQTNWEKVLKIFIASKGLKNCSQGTRYNYYTRLRHLMSSLNKNIEDVSTNDLRYYLAIYKEQHKISDSYIDTIRRYISSFFSFCQVEGYITSNPADRLEKVKVPKTLKRAFTQRDLVILKENADSIRDLALIEVMYSTAGRVGEIVALNKQDINFTTREVNLYGFKGKAERKVYLTEEALYYLEKYLESRNDKNDALFVGLKKPYNRMSKENIELRVRTIGQKCGIKAYPHKFRRSFLSDGSHRGMNLQELQKYAGHVKPETTMMYLDIKNEDIHSSFNKHIG